MACILIWRRGRDYSSLRSSPLRGRRRNAPALSRTAARRSARTEGFSSNLHTPDKAKGPTRGPFALLAEREGFEPSIRYERIHTFHACSLNHSYTSPKNLTCGKPGLDLTICRNLVGKPTGILAVLIRNKAYDAQHPHGLVT